jgi:hypothetical protein
VTGDGTEVLLLPELQDVTQNIALTMTKINAIPWKVLPILDRLRLERARSPSNPGAANARERGPDLPVLTRRLRLATGAAVNVTATVCGGLAFCQASWVELRLQVTPGADGTQFRETLKVPWAPHSGVTVKASCWLCPGWSVTLDGLSTSDVPRPTATGKIPVLAVWFGSPL